MIQFDDFQDRLAVVTGATQGIGRATCRMLLDQGARVIGLARGESRFEDDARYTHLRCDLADAAAIEAAFDRVAAEHDALDYVVNVAGYDPKFTLEEGDADHWDALVNLNLRGYYLVIRRAVPLLRRGLGKAIVNVSSINYRLGLPKRSIYSTTKAGILGLTTAWPGNWELTESALTPSPRAGSSPNGRWESTSPTPKIAKPTWPRSATCSRSTARSHPGTWPITSSSTSPTPALHPPATTASSTAAGFWNEPEATRELRKRRNHLCCLCFLLFLLSLISVD